MPRGLFKYERDLMKHHVRLMGWLPRCKERQRIVRAHLPDGKPRRLRYFTFCAVGAIDVLMLDVAKVLTGSDERRFGNVCFFDKSPDLVRETQKRIPGATGFSGDFVDTVLLDDPEEEGLLAQRPPLLDGNDPLIPPQSARDESAIRGLQLRVNSRQQLLERFPFDVINLDLEEYLFKPKEKLPGRVVNAMRKVFEWQRREFTLPTRKSSHTLSGFSLMFTTRVGPENLTENYLSMLRRYLEENIQRDPDLSRVLRNRTGIATVTDLQNSNFEGFFKLAMPKVLAATLMEQDWYVDPSSGLSIYEFARTPVGSPSFRMLHLVMDVIRCNPPRGGRAPNAVSPEAVSAYGSIVKQIFENPPVDLTELSLDKARLQENLDLIIARRKKYCPDED